MVQVIVLGGCGTVGSIAVRTLASLGDFSEIIIGDIDERSALNLASEIGPECVASFFDALDSKSIEKAVKDSDVVLNCVGPFYRFGPPILEATIEAGINYVDVCDDVDPTRNQLAMHAKAKKAGITACIGMGSSPGITNLFAKLSAEQLLDEIEAIDIYHCHGGEPTEGAAVIAHRIHAMTSDIPMYLDGKLKTVQFFDESGVALRENIDFHLIGKHQVYPYPHPETVTLPKYINCQRVTNKGTVIPDEYFQFIMQVVKLGLVSETPIQVKEQQVIPRDFAIAYILKERQRILRETQFGEQRGCLKTVISGKKQGKSHQYVFSLASRSQAMGEATGIPAAIGATLMIRGKIQEKGVLPPEACIKPMDFLTLISKALQLKQLTGKGSPIIIESIDDQGTVKRINL